MEKVKTYFDPHWGIVLRRMRESRNKTERDTAKALGCSHVAIHHWETGETQISQPILYTLLEFYEYSLSEFLALLYKEKHP